jgi:hypothetical protein
MQSPYRRESVRLRCGGLGLRSRRLRADDKITPLPARSVMPERRARQRTDDSAFAGPRSSAPRAEGGASGTRACRAQKLLGDSEGVASYARPLRVSTLFLAAIIASATLATQQKGRSPSTPIAPLLTWCSAYHLAEAQYMASPVQGASPAKTWASARPRSCPWPPSSPFSKLR